MKKNKIYKTESGKGKKSRLFSYFATFLMLSTLSIPLATQSSVSSSNSVKTKNAVQKAVEVTYGTNIVEVSPSFDTTFYVSPESATRTDTTITYTTVFGYTSLTDFYLFGYYDEEVRYEPFTLVYDVIGTDGSSRETKTYEFPNYSSINPFFGVGDILGGSEISLTVPFEVGVGESLDFETVAFVNIFSCSRPDGATSIVPNFDRRFYYNCGTPLSAITVQTSEELVAMKLSGYADLGKYTMISFDYEINAVESYKTFRGSAYRSAEAELETGARYIRYRFNAVGSSSIDITYTDGSTETKSFHGASAAIVLSGNGGKFNLLVDNIDSSKIAHISLRNFIFNISIVVTKTGLIQSRSELSKNFALIEYTSEGISNNNVTMQLIIEILVFCLVYVAAAVGIYFYQKNKYKNDEFRRVDNKKFIKTAGTGFIALASIFLLIIFIIYRLTSMFTSAVIYNPCDIPICIFLVSTIVMTGYFIKFFFNMYKNHKTKKMIERLKLGEKEDDDGTN